MKSIVSIIIPVYNVKKYLVKCVESVIKQTYSDLQIILVDDGSTDGCSFICDELSYQDSRIEVIHKVNGGLSSARNAGLRAVKGQYIYFLDADDYIEPQLVEICVNTIVSQECDAVVFNFVFEDEFGNVIFKSHFRRNTYQLATKKEKMQFIAYVQIERDNGGWNAWNRFYKADILLNNQIYFPDNNEIFAEDLAHAMRVCLYLNNLCVIPDSLYHYISRSDSIMGRAVQTPLRKFVRLCTDFEAYTKRHGFYKELSVLKEYIFSVILYYELKKQCKNFHEMANAISMLGEKQKKEIQSWFSNIKYKHLIYTRHKIKRFFACCEAHLTSFILSGKNVHTTFEYWIWCILWNFNKGRHFLNGKMQK